MYQFLDVFFVVFHSLLIVFNVFGWVWIKTRKVNLITLLLTGGSWFILGIFKGIGYCPLTDWHWQVLHKLGNTELPNSYIKYLIDRIFKVDINLDLVDKATLGFFVGALIISIVINTFDWRKKKQRAYPGK
ncbi:MAG: DUF2784 domain-containing protein [Bacteroidales bacterium]|nr:DUF2784 domain-containing protein [Bacteroidales bacterium]